MRKFDVFSGLPENPLWLEVADGLTNAVARMERRAYANPGHYFVYDVGRQAIIASIDTQRSKIVRGKRNLTSS